MYLVITVATPSICIARLPLSDQDLAEDILVQHQGATLFHEFITKFNLREYYNITRPYLILKYRTHDLNFR